MTPKTRRFPIAVAALVLLLTALVTIPTFAAIGDIWALHGSSTTDVVRVNSSGNLLSLSGFALRRHATATSLYADNTDSIIGVTSTSAARGIYMPDVTTTVAGQIFVVTDESGGANSHNIIVYGNGSDTIDGSATSTISSNYGVLRLYSTGATWKTF